MTVPFDTHALVKGLMADGFTEEKAEAVANGRRQARELDLAQLATKEDIALGRAEMQKCAATCWTG